MGRTAIGEETKRTVIELMKMGKTMAEAAEEAGVGLSTVKANWRIWSSELGIDVRVPRVKVEEIPPQVRERVVQLRMAGVTNTAAAQETGVSENVIQAHWRKWAEAIGMKPPPKRAITKPYAERAKTLLKGDRARKRAVLLRNQGWSPAEIEAETGVSARAVERHWREWGREFGLTLVEPMPQEAPPEAGEVIEYRLPPEKRW